MAPKTSTTVVVLLLAGTCAFASPRPLPGTENIPKLLADSTLVCKGEVISAPMQLPVQSLAGMARNTATAQVRPDRCFKGTPHGNSIPVLFDSYALGVSPGSFVLRTGDYRLFFLTPQNGAFAVVDEWFGALTVSRELSPVRENADAMTLLESDLKAGLRDSNPERVLDSIRMLGNMRVLHSTV